ncbi:MAG: DnaD domain protein [Oscillospiraceae bacterium]|nr:DnaD domain protein [Oscillospiraceae bacterium]
MDNKDLMIEWGSGVFAVPDKAASCMAMAGAAELRLLVYVCANKHFPTASEIKVSEDDLEDAVNFWTVNGVFTKKETDKPKAAPKRASAPSFRTIHPAQIAKSIDDDPMLKRLFTELEMISGKPFNHTEQQCLVWMHEFLKLPPDVVLMLYSFSLSNGTPSVSYISKVAQDWCTREINTPEKAEEEILLMQKRRTECDQLTAVLKAAGIAGNHTSAISKWQRNGISAELLSYAIGNISDKAKQNVEYIGKILESYRKEGITDPASAKARDDSFRAQKSPQKREHIYDGEEIQAQLLAQFMDD